MPGLRCKEMLESTGRHLKDVYKRQPEAPRLIRLALIGGAVWENRGLDELIHQMCIRDSNYATDVVRDIYERCFRLFVGTFHLSLFQSHR